MRIKESEKRVLSIITINEAIHLTAEPDYGSSF